MMSLRNLLLVLLSLLALQNTSCFVGKPRQHVVKRTAPLNNVGARTAYTSSDLKDYRAEASSLFGNVRIPAALFAGASAGAAFAMPLGAADGLKLGLVKRVYALLMMTALSSQIVAVVISTLAVGALATKQSSMTESVAALLKEYYDLEWTGARWHFLSGVLMFVLGIGLRAWVTIHCPIIAVAALGIIASGSLLCTAFMEEMQQGDVLDGIFKLPFRYMKLLWQRAKGKPLFAMAFAVSAVTNVYILVKLPHIIGYLTS